MSRDERIVSESETRIMWYADYEDNEVFTRRVFHTGSGHYWNVSQKHDAHYSVVKDQYVVETWGNEYQLAYNVFNTRLDALTAVRLNLVEKFERMQEELTGLDETINAERDTPTPTTYKDLW